MTLEEARRLSGERWPLDEYSRRAYLALYEHHESLIDALRATIARIDELENETMLDTVVYADRKLSEVFDGA